MALVVRFSYRLYCLQIIYVCLLLAFLFRCGKNSLLSPRESFVVVKIEVLLKT